MRKLIDPSLLLLLSCVGQCEAQRAKVVGRQLLVNDQPFLVKGICYSPIPINESVYFAPYGDYFTSEYSFIWLRDLPLIKAMGANVVRTYGWQPDNDHTAFLDAASNAGLYVMATFYMGDAEETPVDSAKDRHKVISDFTSEVVKYASHPSLLFWSFGNELNGVWNKFLQALSKDKDLPGGDCHWDERYDDLGGCWIHKGKEPLPGTRCYETSFCVYKRLFGFIGDAAASAKKHADVLVVSAFADVDGLSDKIDRAGDYAKSVDAWTAQVYRGATFGNFFEQMGNATSKPVLLTEYGVDAYHDVCGNGTHTPCYNTLDDDSGSFEDEEAQAAFATNLTNEIVAASSEHAGCEGAGKGDAQCSCIGGFLMSWTDEYWKGAKSQAACAPTMSSSHFSPKKCQAKAHVTCGNWDAADHDLCGYWLEAAPDHYVNEEWFGITAPERCADSIDSLRPRQTFFTMREIWTGDTHHDALRNMFGSCDDMLLGSDDDEDEEDEKTTTTSAASGGKGKGKGGGKVTRKHASSTPHPPVCSGRGRCTTDWRECGPGGPNATATPCCKCVFGFAGAGCGELDVRIYIAAGASTVLAGLLVLMLGCSGVHVLLRKLGVGGVKSAELSEKLLS